MDLENLYEDYAKEVKKILNGLVETNKGEFYKFCIFYNMMKDLEKEEAKRQLQKQKEFKKNFEMEYECIWKGKSEKEGNNK